MWTNVEMNKYRHKPSQNYIHAKFLAILVGKQESSDLDYEQQ